MKVRISEIIKIHERLAELNHTSVDLNDIEFLDDNDQPIQIDSKIIEDFKFIGLNNTDFISTGFYKKGWDKTN